MKKYKYVKVKFTTVWSTDPSIVNWIYDEIKKIIPTCAVREERYDLTGEKIGFELHKLQNKDNQVADWILRLLCENGFEMDAEITALEGKLSKAREVKQGMMSVLLTGRIRLVESG
jgi:hypothetical protein